MAQYFAEADHAVVITIVKVLLGTIISAANPLDEECEKEGKVVCHQGRIQGERGKLAVVVCQFLLLHICRFHSRANQRLGSSYA